VHPQLKNSSMKLRIKGNTLRFRLTKSEVEYFAEENLLEEKTEFGNNTLTYSLKTINAETLSADFSNNRITLFIPQHLAKEWITTEKVGLQGEMETGNAKKLFLLLEKDYKCLDVVAEDQSDNYENPQRITN
jgi:hypothetical protein